MKSIAIIIFTCCHMMIQSATPNPCITNLGLNGTCMPITDCRYVTDQLNAGDLRDLTPCETDGTVGIFCCPTDVKVNSEIKFSESCKQIITLKDQLNPKMTKYRENVSNISTGELPFMVQVHFPNKGLVGAGALISEKFVLTSAHIVYVRLSMPFVRLGKTSINDDDGSIGVDARVKQIIPHELYTPREKYYDIALLLLKRSVKFRNHIWPACLSNFDLRLSGNEIYTLSGWMKNRKLSNWMLKSSLIHINSTECQKFYSTRDFVVSLPSGITGNLFCAYNEECGFDDADSDGPVFVNVNGTFFIYAIAGNVETDCNAAKPGIYSRISDVGNWIEGIILGTS